MTNPIQLLPAEEFKVLKIIRIDGPDWNRFTAHLPYIRTFNPEKYNSKKGDLLDEKILSSIKEIYPTSLLRYNIDILFKGELEDNLRYIERPTKKDIIIQFFPHIDYDQIRELEGREFSFYPLTFSLRIDISMDKENIQLINDFYRCDIPHAEINELVKTIRVI